MIIDYTEEWQKPSESNKIAVKHITEKIIDHMKKLNLVNIKVIQIKAKYSSF